MKGEAYFEQVMPNYTRTVKLTEGIPFCCKVNLCERPPLTINLKYLDGLNATIKLFGTWTAEIPDVRRNQYGKNPKQIKVFGPQGEQESFSEEEWFYLVIDADQSATISIKASFTVKTTQDEMQEKEEKRKAY